MHVVATTLAPFVARTITTALWAAAGLGVFWMVLTAPCSADRAERYSAAGGDLLEVAHGPNVALTARETLELQLGALGNNGELGRDAGIRYAYELASDANRSVTGPFTKFARMVKGSTYGILVDFKTVEIDAIGGCRSRAVFSVEVVGQLDDEAEFLWELSRREVDGAFVTDSVVRLR